MHNPLKRLIIFVICLVLNPLAHARFDITEKTPLRVGLLKQTKSLSNKLQYDESFYGIYNDYIKNISKALGVSVEVTAYSDVGDILAAVDQGVIDGALGLSLSPSREKRFLFSQPLFRSSSVVWYQDKGLKSLPPYQVSWACVISSPHCKQLENNKLTSIRRYPNLIAAFQAVQTGKASAVISSYIQVNQYLDQHNIVTGIVDMPYWVEPEEIRLITTKSNFELIEQINKVLEWEAKGLNIRSISSENPYYVGDKLLREYLESHPDNTPITYSTSINAYPFMFRDEKGNLDGFLADFFNMLYARTGINFEYKEPKSNGKSDFTAFQADLVPVAYMHAPRSTDWEISHPFMSVKFVSIESFRPGLSRTSSTNKKGILISLTKQGTVHLESWRDEGIVRYSSLKKLISDINSGKIAEGYVPSDIAKTLIAQNATEDMLFGQHEPLTLSLAFAIASDRDEITPLLNSILENIDQQEIDKLSRIYQQFSVTYGYDNQYLLKLGLIVVAFLVVLFILIFLAVKHLKLKVQLAQVSAVNEEQEKLWLKEIIQEFISLVFIHDESNNLLLSNCSRFRNGQCDKCLMRDVNSNEYLINNTIEVRNVLDGEKISDNHEIYDCSLNIRHIYRERKLTQSPNSSKRFVLTIIQDVTEQTQREQALLEAKQDAQNAMLSRERFLATMSHELRTPIGAVHGILDLLSRPQERTSQVELVGQAQKSLHHLNALVDEILDFSKLDAGQLSVQPEKTDILASLGNVLRSFETQARMKGLDYIVEIRPFDNHWIEIDEVRFVQIVSNLLSNAIKFTNLGYIRITVTLNKDRLSVIVSDSGIGMSQEQQQEVLKPFVQADDTVTREFGGTGLGLSIVDKLTQCMGGKLTIESMQSVGTTMRVTLPITLSDSCDLARLNHLTFSESLPIELVQWCRAWGMTATQDKADLYVVPNSSPAQVITHSDAKLVQHEYKYPDLLLNSLLTTNTSTSGCSEIVSGGLFLIAEDNKINQNVLKMQFKELNLNNVIVDNGEQAWEYLHENPNVDILFTDFHMPVLSGYELVERIRKTEKFKDLTVIGLTAEDSRVANELAKNSGIDEILYKPYDVEQLHSIICKYLNKESGYKPDWLDRYTNDDALEIGQLFVQTMTEDLAALQKETYETERKKVIHSIKGACFTIGLNHITNICKEAESSSDTEFEESVAAINKQLSKEVSAVSAWIKNNE